WWIRGDMDSGSAGQKAGPHRARGACHYQYGLWRRRLENPVLHRPDSPGRSQREDPWHARTDPGTEEIALIVERPGMLVALIIPTLAPPGVHLCSPCSTPGCPEGRYSQTLHALPL